VDCSSAAGVDSRTPAFDFILIDFDGTLAAADVGNQFFHHFARDEESWQRIIEDWKHERLSARQCLALECALAKVEEGEALQFFKKFSLTADAPEFVRLAQSRGHHAVVASDGLEIYISKLLRRAGLELPFTANGIQFGALGPIPEFASLGPDVKLPDGRTARAREQATPGCGHCGNCKGAVIEEARRQGTWRRLLLVGDGYSDRCAASVADRIYAKDDLLGYCEEHGIPCKPFTELMDVARAEHWVGPG